MGMGLTAIAINNCSPLLLSPTPPPPITTRSTEGTKKRPPCLLAHQTAAASTSTSTSTSLSRRLAALCSEGRPRDALPLLLSLPPDLLPLHSDAVSLLLQSCASTADLELGRRVHRLLLLSPSPGFLADPVLSTRLLTMYAACGAADDARRVFDALPRRNLFQWNAMISGCARNQLFGDALELFLRFLSETVLVPDHFTIPCVLKSCAGLLDAELGGAVHGVAVKLGLGTDVFVNNSLVSMYGKCGRVVDAVRVFETMPERNLVSWNTMMSGFSDSGLLQEGFDLFREMMVLAAEQSMKPDDATVVTVLPMCAASRWLEMGRLVHGLSLKLALASELRVNNALVDMYAKCDSLLDAQCLFSNNPRRNAVSWNALIGGFARDGEADATLHLLRTMQREEDIKVNEVTVLNVLPVCLGPSELQYVKELHAYVIRNCLQTNDLLPNALIAAYSKCGSPKYADNVFERMNVKTVSSWNALIGGYAQNGDPRKAVDLFLQMTSSGTKPDWFSIGSLLLACAHLKDLLSGMSAHGLILRNGWDRDSFLAISLLSLYMSCGYESKARLIFYAMEDRDIVSWNAMISGYCQNGFPDESLRLFREVQDYGYEPSAIAITTAFMACAELLALRLGKETHCFVLRSNISDDAFVGSSIIDMYAKCGCIDQARIFFDHLKDKDAVSWTVMITGYGINGYGHEAICLFNEMEDRGLKPDAFTYIGILMACNHAGLVNEGLVYFDKVKNEPGIELKLEHYACVADMLGRAGQLTEAAKLIDEMPEEPDAKMWAALLGACRTHGDISLGEKVAEKLLELEPEKVEHYVLASNLYAGSGRWDDVRRIRKRMKEFGLQKDPGCSWIDVGGKVYSFVSGDNRLPESEEIHKMWCYLEQRICRIGYVPDTVSVLHDLKEDEKLEILRGHSEKQALAFGLLKLSGSRKIRICKNIRICKDCHNAAKLVSKVVEREIVMRDNKRFHHFKDGLCSCGDFW